MLKEKTMYEITCDICGDKQLFNEYPQNTSVIAQGLQITTESKEYCGDDGEYIYEPAHICDSCIRKIKDTISYIRTEYTAK